jgi:hypothetical protein
MANWKNEWEMDNGIKRDPDEITCEDKRKM